MRHRAWWSPYGDAAAVRPRVVVGRRKGLDNKAGHTCAVPAVQAVQRAQQTTPKTKTRTKNERENCPEEGRVPAE